MEKTVFFVFCLIVSLFTFAAGSAFAETEITINPSADANVNSQQTELQKLANKDVKGIKKNINDLVATNKAIDKMNQQKKEKEDKEKKDAEKREQTLLLATAGAVLFCAAILVGIVLVFRHFLKAKRIQKNRRPKARQKEA